MPDPNDFQKQIAAMREEAAEELEKEVLEGDPKEQPSGLIGVGMVDKDHPDNEKVKKTLEAEGIEVSEVTGVHIEATCDSFQVDRAKTPVAPKPAPKRQPWRRRYPKIGRNEPCGCGSGHKYKKCCGKIK